jgi:hypothetical protein
MHATRSESRVSNPGGVIVILLLASMVFVMNVSVAIHEMGHLLFDRIYGLDARVVLEIFRGSHITLGEIYPSDLSVVPVLAGPLGNVLVGTALFAALWRVRRPALLPLLLWGPIALLQESTSALVQLIERDPGTDFVMIHQAGVAQGAIIALAVVGIVAGLVGVLALMPVAGLDPLTSVWRRIAVFLPGMSGYSIFVLMASLSLGYPESDLVRNAGLASLVAVVSVCLAVGYAPVGRWLRLRIHEVRRQSVWLAAALTAAVIALYGWV